MSRADTNVSKPQTSTKIKLGSMKPTEHGIESCKIVCFSTPFCRYYEYVLFDDSCNFYSDSGIEDSYKSLVDRLKNTSTPSLPSASSSEGNFTFFNLIHLLQADLFNLVEEKA